MQVFFLFSFGTPGKRSQKVERKSRNYQQQKI
jgi:hypothetical protein